MANEQYAFMSRAKVPSREQWQAAIDDAGLDLKLDSGLTPFEDSGFLPCRLNGAEAGFEIYYETSQNDLKEFGELADGADCFISFRWGGSMMECASVMVASYALARSFAAVVSYEGEDPFNDLESFRHETLAIIEDAFSDSF